MSIPQHVIDKFITSLENTLEHYKTIPGNHQAEIDAINQALYYGIGRPESSKGVSLAVKYKGELNDKLKKALEQSPSKNGSKNGNLKALMLRRTKAANRLAANQSAANRLAANQSNANRLAANRSGNGRVTRNRPRNTKPTVGSPLAKNAREKLGMGGLH